MEVRLETQQNSFDRIQNLVYEKIPTFERRITQLQNQIKMLLEPSKQSMMNHTGGGAIRLQTTPRYDSTLAVS